MKLRNIANAFVRVESDGIVLLIDPWINPAFEGTIIPYPPIVDAPGSIAGATHCFLSHIHSDHFDRETLAELDRGTTIFIPDLWPNHIMRNAVKSLSFTDIVMMEVGKPYQPAFPRWLH